MREGQCYSCYMHTHFQLFGQTKEYNEHAISKNYIKGLETGNEVDCFTCGVKVKYTKNIDGIYDEEIIK